MSLKHFLNTQDWSRPELDALLTQAARHHPQMRTISRESIRRLLKKTSSNPGAS